MKLRLRITALLVAVLALARALASADRKPQGLREWAVEFHENLLPGVLQFWIDHAIDRRYGGMIGWLDRQGNPIPPGTKSLVQQARVVWTFAAAYRQHPDPVYKEVATHTLKFLREKMWDAKDGGFYWLVNREGGVVDGKKHLYGQSFAIYGLAEYARAFGDAQARKEALELFHLIDRKGHDEVNGGYREAFSENWQPLQDDATVGAHGRKSMNTHIHLLESFTTLYKATADAQVRARVEELLKICAEKIVDERQGHARLFFTDDWRPADSDTSSYGHDIELSWLLTESATALGRPRDPKIVSLSLAMVEHTLRDGFDRERGGVYDEGPAAGPAASKSMIWWVEAEALVGLLNAYQLTGKPEYRDRFEQQANYVRDHFVDRQYGEWFNTIEPDGTVTGNKTDEWKGPYHAGRACLEVIERLEGRP
jgi:cellobiose epimerase